MKLVTMRRRRLLLLPYTCSTCRRLFVSFIALKADIQHGVAITTTTTTSSSSSLFCRSNSTHIVWKEPSTIPLNIRDEQHVIVSTLRSNRETAALSQQEEEQQQQLLPTVCTVQTRKEAEDECMNFLKDNVMAFDRPFRETMGFPVDDENDDVTADGLDNGMIGPTITLALDAKVLFPWTDDLPKDVFMDYVLNYGNLNEARTNWRPLLVDALKFNESDLWTNHREGANIKSVTTWVNTHLWTLLGRNGKPIYFKSSQTPLIFDPMSIIAFGYASCTGTSILFCNALRAVGIPARVAGTPAWYGNRTQGNHNWVEVWDGSVTGGGGEWKFLEPSPALPTIDTLDTDPCDRWFCDPSRYPSSKVYAAKMSKKKTKSSSGPTVPDAADCDCTHFPLAWQWDCHDVPAVDRTDYYARICGSCGREDSESINWSNKKGEVLHSFLFFGWGYIIGMCHGLVVM